MENPLADDLDQVLAQTGALWDELRGARLFITGGTGFFGCWLLETLLWANDRLGLKASAVVLTRDSRAFEKKAPHLAGHPTVRFHEGDVRTFAFADGAFSHVIHAATDTGPVPGAEDRQRVFDSIVEGTRRTLDFAQRTGARRFLLTSSGAVYGRQPADITRVSEEYTGGPDPADVTSSGGEAKRAAETLCAIYANARLTPTIARCFAFVGPYLPLGAHLAAGNFVRDALQGGPIRVSGDGTPVRSYMYAGDLAAWLWTVLLHGQSMRPYNVGSEVPISILDLARAVARQCAPLCEVRLARTAVPGAPADRYVPNTARVRGELGLGLTVNVEDALARTVGWYRARVGSSHVSH